MSYAYTPGLKVMESTIIRKIRTLPIPGEIHVKKGESVSYETVVASTHIPGGVSMRNAGNILDVGPTYLPLVLQKKEGDIVKKGDLIGLNKQFFGLIKKEFRAEVDGTIEMISSVTGNIAIREAPMLITRNAYISGKILEIIPKMGAVIETPAALIQGIFGISGEKHGEIKVIASPNEVLMPEMIDESCRGKILVGGSLVTENALRKSIEIGAKGVVGGGIKRGDVNKILGYELGVAITGKENLSLTCIITEGFGKMNMAEHTFNLLSSQEGMTASIDGTTQIRAGVIRPEIIIPKKKVEKLTEGEVIITDQGMVPGTLVRIIREPHFGAIAHIISLPIEPQKVETGSKVRVALVELGDRTQLIVPRANLELMER
jgi:hypothetical protein